VNVDFPCKSLPWAVGQKDAVILAFSHIFSHNNPYLTAYGRKDLEIGNKFSTSSISNFIMYDSCHRVTRKETYKIQTF
jgi:hypothetical protein